MKLILSEFGINETREDILYLRKTIKDTTKLAVRKVMEAGIDEAKLWNSKAPKTGVEDNQIYGTSSKDGYSRQVVMSGPNAIYDEFGTGEEGAAEPHLLKSRFGLNPYNSGPYVSTHINKKNGRHYWFYAPMGRIEPRYFEPNGYTEGTPSGKQMYNTLRYLERNASNIVKEEFSNALNIFR